jgi:hypothetical protein
VNDETGTSTIAKQQVVTPVRAKPVLVQRPHCRCMAYQDSHGKWRDYFHRDELTDVLEVIPLD